MHTAAHIPKTAAGYTPPPKSGGAPENSWFCRINTYVKWQIYCLKWLSMDWRTYYKNCILFCAHFNYGAHLNNVFAALTHMPPVKYIASHICIPKDGRIKTHMPHAYGENTLIAFWQICTSATTSSAAFKKICIAAHCNYLAYIFFSLYFTAYAAVFICALTLYQPQHIFIAADIKAYTYALWRQKALFYDFKRIRRIWHISAFYDIFCTPKKFWRGQILISIFSLIFLCILILLFYFVFKFLDELLFCRLLAGRFWLGGSYFYLYSRKSNLLWLTTAAINRHIF